MSLRSARWLRWGAVAAAGMAASLVAVTPAAAAPADLTGGSLTWGLRTSFRSYVVGDTANAGTPPAIEASGGASYNHNAGLFTFPSTGGTYDAATGALTANFGGTVVFRQFQNHFVITLANPTIVLGGGAPVLRADITVVSTLVPTAIDRDQADIGDLDITGIAPTTDGAVTTWSAVPGVLSEAGAEALGDFLSAGAELDPATFTVSTGAPPPATPTVVVTPATSGLSADGTTLTVTGSGFPYGIYSNNPATSQDPGFYVAFGPKRADWITNTSHYLQSKWVRGNATPSTSPGVVDLKPDGTFTTTLDVRPVYTKGEAEYDCYAEQCYILTWTAHQAFDDRGRDTLTPIIFAAPVLGEGGQVVTAEVLGTGPLTLTSSGASVALSGANPGSLATGTLHTLTVADLRGTNGGWNLVGQVQTFASGSGATIEAANLGWVPNAAVVADGFVGSLGVVSAGAVVTPGVDGGLGAARTLCSAATGASAGTFTCGADLNLGVPASATPGTYSATLTLTLV